MDATEWSRRHIQTLARRHFKRGGGALEALLTTLQRAHEARWRSSGAGRYRPTLSMYAVALGWELGRRGPRCGVCEGALEVPEPARRGAAPRAMTLVPRTSETSGGLNVPQNLVVGHCGCLPAT